MKKNKRPIITVDLNKWITQTDLVNESKGALKQSALSMRIKRTNEGTTPNPLEIWHIPELNITLVKRED